MQSLYGCRKNLDGVKDSRVVGGGKKDKGEILYTNTNGVALSDQGTGYLVIKTPELAFS